MEHKHLSAADLSKFVQASMEKLPSTPDEQSLQGCSFDIRRSLIDKIIQIYSPDTDDFMQMDKQENHADILRKALPPLQTPTVRPQAKPSALRAALLAILGLLFGSAIGQGLSMMESLSFGSSSMVICGILGVTSMLWLSEFLLHAANKGTLTLPWGVYKWSKARKIFTITWFGLLGLSIVRDFFSGRVGLVHLLESLGAFLNRGDVLNIFTNTYGVLGFVGLIALLLKRPKSFDKDDFAQKLEVAASNWWVNAELAASLLMEIDNIKNDPSRKEWQQVGREIYSFSAELPQAQQQWLLERLSRLGLQTSQDVGALVWRKDMLEHYTPLGHIEIGDNCYVDEPAILENNVVVKKGTVRKVR